MFGLPDQVAACLFDMDGVVTQTAVVFEDALAGVEAGQAGHFALVVGVDRVDQAAELSEHGADVVARDVAELLGQDGQGAR
jgi:beta-phosphoglucomutase-like phosphatase (HAD superfamily)